MTKPLLDVQHVEVSYSGRPVVHDVSFQMKPGEVLGIVGESGSGKSTLIKAAMGLLGNNGVITKGDIYYKGHNVIDAKYDDIRKMRGPEMGMIFQNTEAVLCPIRTIEEQLYESVTQHERVSRAEIRTRAREIFDKMNLTDSDRILKSYPFELSGGMNQRVGIMMAMILKPDLLFADEPTSALDVTVQAQIVREMMKMHELYGMAIAMVTHNIGVVAHMADKIAVMYQGRLVEYGKKEDVIYHPQEPYTKKLIGAVLRINRGED
ncbi:ABC transporter ATP-binding protein [Fusibacter sp. Q10-2]|uniref:ABC transporter ATP-binding protein n=2 Tax=Fusibacter ferrireducens TaxID=2785058 RepID=A0ABR9ZWF0_9FIRM|nr:ABC transporter ATP-binding protein [Fusibacter ferrireducens]